MDIITIDKIKLYQNMNIKEINNFIKEIAGTITITTTKEDQTTSITGLMEI